MKIPKPAYQIFDNAADVYQEKYMDVSKYADSFSVFCAAIPSGNAKVLELACGPGNVTKFILEKRPDFSILATDLAPKMVKLAKINNPEIETRILDVKDVLTLNQRFDAVLCAFCLPYLSKEETLKLLIDTHQTLHPNGMFYLSTIEDDYSNSKITGSERYGALRQYFYTEKLLVDLLSQSGFKVLSIHRVETVQEDKSVVVDIALVAKRGKKKSQICFRKNGILNMIKSLIKNARILRKRNSLQFVRYHRTLTNENKKTRCRLSSYRVSFSCAELENLIRTVVGWQSYY